MDVIGGETGTVLSSSVIQPADTVRVKVTDGDENENSGGIENVSVTVRNLRSGESESVTLTETGADSAIFRGVLTTAYGSGVNSTSGVMNVVGGDTVVVEYVDAKTQTAPNATLKDTTLVVAMFGDVSGDGIVRAYDATLILQEVVGYITLPDADWPNFTLEVGDVTGDGTLSALDAAYILKYVVRKIDSFPVQTKQIPKPVVGERLVWLEHVGEVVYVKIDEMDGVLSGEMTLSLVGDVGDVTVSTTDLTSGYLLASNVRDRRIRASFAGVESNTGPGPVLAIVFGESDAELRSSLRLERVSLNEGRIPVHIDRFESEIPTAYRLTQNHPNPFNPETTITYDVAKTGTVRLSVYALTGQLVRTLIDAERPAGTYSVLWDGRDDAGRDVASGVYLCRMIAGDYRAVRKLVLVR